MTTEQDDKREAPISYRPPAKLRDEFARRVAASGLSTNAFITRAVFNLDPPRRLRRPSSETQAVARLLPKIAALQQQLSEIEASDDAARSARIAEAALRDLDPLMWRALIMQSLGRSS